MSIASDRSLSTSSRLSLLMYSNAGITSLLGTLSALVITWATDDLCVRMGSRARVEGGGVEMWRCGGWRCRAGGGVEGGGGVKVLEVLEVWRVEV